MSKQKVMNLRKTNILCRTVLNLRNASVNGLLDENHSARTDMNLYMAQLGKQEIGESVKSVKESA